MGSFVGGSFVGADPVEMDEDRSHMGSWRRYRSWQNKWKQPEVGAAEILGGPESVQITAGPEIQAMPNVGSFVGSAKKPAAKPSAAVPPPIPGEPVDTNVAVTAAANSMHVPPAVAMSIVAAAHAGDKNARKGIEEAAAVYKAAQKGDPVAKKQLAAVTKDAKDRDPAALQKAAFMAAAVGTLKGRKLHKQRKAGIVASAPGAAGEAAPNPLGLPGWLLKFGGETGPFLRYYQGIRG
jgi:hypothetical protein